MRTKHRVAALISLLAAACAGPGARREIEPWYGAPTDNRTDFAARLLRAHNTERARQGLAPLVWNPVLADHAQRYAQQLASANRFEHSANAARPGEGENLWKGTAGAYTLEEMMGHFIDEKRDFRPGVFPRVARDGQWEEVAHYTQMIWPDTTEVGCALVSRGGTDWLVCRYAPLGNIVGERVG
ncbi:CAP domain-containing protein [Novosphingobium sp. 9]|uniref:CAP domain-containing protein n=1 Tax=Novosphingobium sp. 9 TaxID=2025349 RepID=UPI0021B6ABCB|nr:CAP domain-containing protein [Novosphingobium sp. 9]